eukprot:comp24333_c4_seq1/m.46044 comp24333_c4_seq1/g.46044  ORF comp24333_c4_seq1/g.46044 comp24333_c4_seq1/m.46044 type:complete len:574 (+) comp24333_c4_seq1:1168-2889(+)
MEGGRSGGGHPCSVGTGQRVGNLGCNHLLHGVGGGPHSLPDLGVARQAGLDAHVEVPVLVGGQPGLVLDVGLGAEHTRLDGGVDLVTGSVQETSVDEHHPLTGCTDALFQVDRRAPLLVHDADLECVAGQAQCVLDPSKQLHVEGHLLRAVHLRLDNVHGARLAVAQLVEPLEVVQRCKGSHHAVHHPLVGLLAVELDGVRLHVDTNVAHKHERTARESEAAAAGGSVGAVLVEVAGDGLTALLKVRGDITLHQAGPHRVHKHLVLGINGCNRVLTVHDSRQRRLQGHILDLCRVQCSHGALAVKVKGNLNVHAIVAQQHRGQLTAPHRVAHKLSRGGKPSALAILHRGNQLGIGHAQALHRAPRGALEGGGTIQKPVDILEHLLGTLGVKPFAPLSTVVIRNSVCAIEGIKQGTPAGISGVKRIAGIVHGHHQLGASNVGNLGVNVGGRHLELGALREEVADLSEECLVGGHVPGLVPVGHVVGVQLGLDLIALGKERLVARRQIRQDALKALEEIIGLDASAWGNDVLDEVVQARVDLHVADSVGVALGDHSWHRLEKFRLSDAVEQLSDG